MCAAPNSGLSVFDHLLTGCRRRPAPGRVRRIDHPCWNLTHRRASPDPSGSLGSRSLKGHFLRTDSFQRYIAEIYRENHDKLFLNIRS